MNLPGTDCTVAVCALAFLAAGELLFCSAAFVCNRFSNVL